MNVEARDLGAALVGDVRFYVEQAGDLPAHGAGDARHVLGRGRGRCTTVKLPVWSRPRIPRFLARRRRPVVMAATNARSTALASRGE